MSDPVPDKSSPEPVRPSAALSVVIGEEKRKNDRRGSAERNVDSEQRKTKATTRQPAANQTPRKPATRRTKPPIEESLLEPLSTRIRRDQHLALKRIVFERASERHPVRTITRIVEDALTDWLAKHSG